MSKLTFEQLDLKNNVYQCFSCVDHSCIGTIIAKVTLEELRSSPDWAGTFGPDFEEEEWPENFDYVIVDESTGDIQDGLNIYNYDCDPCGVYCRKSLHDRLEDEDISIDDIVRILNSNGISGVTIENRFESHIFAWIGLDEKLTELLGEPMLGGTEFYQRNPTSTIREDHGQQISKNLSIVDNDNGFITIFITTEFKTMFKIV